MKARWEVFNPKDGEARLTFRWRWMARVVAHMTGMDYTRCGEGW